jgi:hypothetical protein
MTIDWRDESHLAVEFEVSTLATVFHMFHQYPVVGQRQVQVLFSERAPSLERQHEFKCRSAGREILNPPLKRLAVE